MTDETTVFPSEVEIAATDNVEFIEPSDVGPAPAPEPANFPIPAFKVVVWFDFTKGDFRDKQRVVLNGVVDIRTEADLVNVEGLIQKQLGYDRVFITAWRRLEG